MPKNKKSHSKVSKSSALQSQNQAQQLLAIKGNPKLDNKPWCWYCDRIFDDDKVLILHQKARHFKCNHCARKLNSASGLVIHVAQVHKIHMEKVPNSIPGHDTPEVEVYGMEGVPHVDLERHCQGLPPQPFKRPKFLESGGLLPLLAAQKASAGAISITGKSELFNETAPSIANSNIVFQDIKQLSPPPHTFVTHSHHFHSGSSTTFPTANHYTHSPTMQNTPMMQHYYGYAQFPSTNTGSNMVMPPFGYPPTQQYTHSIHIHPQMQQIPQHQPLLSQPMPSPPQQQQLPPEEQMPRMTPPYIDATTGKQLSGQILFITDLSMTLEEQRATLSRYQRTINVTL